jgi:ABC-2 type transport system permease protein
MAVYEHRYQSYEGALTSNWKRFLVLPRYAWQGLARSRLFLILMVASLICPLVYTILIYLHHNANALAAFGISPDQVLPIDAAFFQFFVGLQALLAFLVAVLVGPTLVSPDLVHNALPLYLCRPLTRSEYLLGKMVVLVALLSGITWIPGELLFLFQAFLGGGEWLLGEGQKGWLAVAIFLSSMAWILVLTLLALALSAWLRWRAIASGAFFALFIVPFPFGLVIFELFKTRIGFGINLTMALDAIRHGLFGTTSDIPVSLTLGEGGLVWGGYCLVALWLLSRRVRAYEVIAS